MKRTLTALLLVLCLLLSLALSAWAAADKTYFYEQLNASQKSAYDRILSDRSGRTTGKFLLPLRNTTYEGITAYMSDSLNCVFALLKDHPELFWFGAQWSAGWEGTYAAGNVQVDLGLGNVWASGRRSVPADDAYVTARVSELAKRARDSGETWYAWLCFAHDELTRTNRYNLPAAEAKEAFPDFTPWTPLSALDPDLSPVCEGYSAAFKLVCDELGIPCILVCDDTHQWNYVRMEDGKWYGVDVTFDDPVSARKGQDQPVTSGLESRRYFLVGSGNFPDHTPVSRPGEEMRWRYPALSPSDYDPAKAVPADALPPEFDPADAPDSWARTEAAAAISARLVPAALQSRYRADITRLEFARLAVTLVERKTGMGAVDYAASRGLTLSDPFSDTHDPAVLAAYALGIVNGKGGDRFVPDGLITRQEAAKMLTYTAMALGADPEAAGEAFADAGEFGDWAVASIAYVSSAADPDTGNRVMGGVGNGRFHPKGTYTRQQALVTMYRLYKALGA